MSPLIAMLEAAKETALQAREERAAQAAQANAEFEELGEDLAKALDEEEIAAAEEALGLGLELDQKEDEAEDERLAADAALARRVLEEERSLEDACSKDEMLARQLEAQLKKEAIRVAKLEKRERDLANRKMCKDDVKLAEQLAVEIDREQEQLALDEARDRRLAQKIVKEERALLKDLPQTEEKLRTMAREVNGVEALPMRTRLRAKLGAMRKGLSDRTNQQHEAVSKRLGGQLEAAAA